MRTKIARFIKNIPFQIVRHTVKFANYILNTFGTQTWDDETPSVSDKFWIFSSYDEPNTDTEYKIGFVIIAWDYDGIWVGLDWKNKIIEKIQNKFPKARYGFMLFPDRRF